MTTTHYNNHQSNLYVQTSVEDPTRNEITTSNTEAPQTPTKPTATSTVLLERLTKASANEHITQKTQQTFNPYNKSHRERAGVTLSQTGFSMSNESDQAIPTAMNASIRDKIPSNSNGDVSHTESHGNRSPLIDDDTTQGEQEIIFNSPLYIDGKFVPRTNNQDDNTSTIDAQQDESIEF
jgi:hypothetical protein